MSTHTTRRHDSEFVQDFARWPCKVAKCSIHENMGSALTAGWWPRLCYEWWEEGHEPSVQSQWLRQPLRQELTSRSILDSRPFRLGLRNNVGVGVILHLDHEVTVLLKLRVAEDPIQGSFQVTILIKQNVFTMYAVPGLIISWPFEPGCQAGGQEAWIH